MYAFLQSILGTYEPVTYTTYELIGDTIESVQVIPAGCAGVDWLYVLSGIAFLVVLYAVLRMLGGLICKIS